ncbi:MAG TPA: hypothetical protein VFO41_09580 [Alphaproteobacteria bacterium]|nr:hypothetical protein [Alphaproteobacteria bacterium]
MRAVLLLLAIWAALSLPVSLPPHPARLFTAPYLGFALEAGLALAAIALWRWAGWPWGKALRLGLALVLTALAVLQAMGLAALAVTARPLNLLVDVTLIPALFDVLAGSLGWGRTILAAGGVALAVAVVMLAARWLLGQADRLLRQPRGRAAFGVLCAIALLIYAAEGLSPASFGPWRPVTDHAARAVAAQGRVLAETLDRHDAFRQAAADDPFFPERAARGLLGRLGGADVLVIFVESYGTVALDDPGIAPEIRPRLERFAEAAAAAGVGQVSGRLVSPTVGGRSWLAHATLLSGLRVDDQILYGLLLAGERRTLVHAFGGAGYRTVAAMPAITKPWPEGESMAFDAIHPAAGMGYRGPLWYWGTVPDQFALAFLERRERSAPDRPPLFAVAALISSHAPWTPVPGVIGWEALGDGEAFHAFIGNGEAPETVWRSPGKIRAYYARSVGYSIDALAAWAVRFIDDGTLAVVVGDHQPAPVVTGPRAPPTVPIHVLSGDPALLEPFRGWGFEPGMVPKGGEPRPMADFRDFLLDAFSAPRSASETALPSGAGPTVAQGYALTPAARRP